MKTDSRVYFHITILVNRSVQLVARNRELRIEVNVLIIRATSCTLRGVNKKAINICINGLLMLNFEFALIDCLLQSHVETEYYFPYEYASLNHP